MRPVLAAVAALLLPTGCDRPDAPPPAAPTVAPANGTLSFVDGAGDPAATLSCGAGELRIVVPGFQPIGSEDRLTIGTEGEAFALVADLAAPGPGVTASGAPDPDLLNRLARGEALFAMYGQQSAGPLAAASPAGLQALVSACRDTD
jgi:hypothetical protein